MVGVRLDGDAEAGAQERRADLGAGFLHGIGVIAEALAERALQACGAPVQCATSWPSTVYQASVRVRPSPSKKRASSGMWMVSVEGR